MRRTSIPFLTVVVGIYSVGCGGASEPENEGSGEIQGAGGSATVGGTATSLGGMRLTGGSSQTLGGVNAGGVTASGIRPNVGGATRGSTNEGGSTTTYASQPSGGTVATTAGSSLGGNSTAGGVSSVGGVNATGGKATAGAPQTGGASTIGSSPVTGGMPALPKFIGNITTRNMSDFDGMNYSKYWDQITPEDAGKWGSVQASPGGAFNWSTLDAIYAYANTNRILFKEHVFVWGAAQPVRIPSLEQVETWIKSFCERYPNTKLIDVVSEPPPHTTPTYTVVLGAGETGSWPWITKAFKLARKYCGDAILILNDYNNLEYADQQTHFIDIVKDIKANGAPIDAVGCQAHGLKGRSAANVQASIDAMATGTGLPIYITEYDIGDIDSVQLVNFQAHIPVFLNTDSVKGITLWGWINGRTWISNSGLMDGTTPRPAMTWLMEHLKRPVPPN